MADLTPGDVFAGHRIEAIAGRGGMGVVYLATELALDRRIALKLIAPALAGDPEFRARFVRESRAAASIEHPNVIPIFSAGEEQDVLYISMRFVDGEDLRALLRREGPLEPRRAARIVAQVADALDAAHARGLVHRDVKPANILLTPTDHAYLTDFGLIKRVGEGATQVSRPGGWVGTLGYVAPEQIRGERVDARADVYALGSVLFNALTGAPPFKADTDEAILWRHLHEEPPRVGPGAPTAFDPVIRRALAKDPAHRYPSAGDLGRAALAAAGVPVADEPERQVARGPAAPAAGAEEQTVLSPGSVTAPTAAVPATPRERPRRRRGAVIALAALGVAAVAVAAIVVAAGGGDGGSEHPPATTSATPSGAVAGRVGEAVPVVSRPNALAIAGGQVWVAGFPDTRLQRLDADTGEPRGTTPVARGTTEMAVGRGLVWIANQERQTVARVSVRTHRPAGQPFAVAGRPVAIAVTRGAVWVGSRTGARSGARTQLLLKLDPRTGALLNTVPIAYGVQSLALGEGAVWVTNRFRSTVTRVDTRTGRQRVIQVGRDPSGVDVGGGFVWVANEGDDTLSRIDPATNTATTVGVGLRPRSVAVNRFAVWASGYDESKIARVDPRSQRPVGEPLPTAINPFKLALSGRTLWVIATGAGVAQKVTF
ncbi:MAG TPA: protein kinase [Solirubrobacteraceae bacterium]